MPQKLIDIAMFIYNNGPAFVAAVLAVLVGVAAVFHAMIGVAMLIPGEQPEKFLQSLSDKFQKVIDFVAKYSKKSS